MAGYDDATALGFDIDISTGDMTLDGNGDIAKVFGADLVNQRLYVMSMVSQRTLLFHPEFGIGIPKLVGAPVSDSAPYNIGNLVATAYAQDPAVVSVSFVDVERVDDRTIVIIPTLVLVGGAFSTPRLAIPLGG